MKIKELIEFLAVLKQIQNVESSASFSYSVMKNKSFAEVAILPLKDELLQNINGEDGNNYRKERSEIIDLYVEKDEKGNPKTEVSTDDRLRHFVLNGKNKKIFDKELDKLDKKYSEYINSIKLKQKDIEELLEKEINIYFKKVSIDKFPDKITPKQMEILSFMLDEGEKNDK